MIRILKQKEIKEILFHGRNAPEYEITKILDELGKNNPTIYRLIYGESTDAIKRINKEMTYLYINLAVEMVFVFRKAFGKPPVVNNEEEWVLKQLSLIDIELKSITKEIPMNDKFRIKLQERLIKMGTSSKIQFELLEYLENEVTKYVSSKAERKTAIYMVNNLLYVFVRLMGDFYNLKK